MLAKRRTLVFPNGPTIGTPLLLPSFSSKTFPNEKVDSIVDYASNLITDEILVSAYDIHYKLVKKSRLTFQSAIFLDSGGYEASEDLDLSDTGKEPHVPMTWDRKSHASVLDDWDFANPTVVVSFDSPRHRCQLSEQITRAKALAKKYPRAVHEIIIKPRKRQKDLLMSTN